MSNPERKNAMTQRNMPYIRRWSTVCSIAMLLVGTTAMTSTADAQPFAYISNGDDNTVSVIDTTSNLVIATVPVGNIPRGVGVNPNGLYVYVVNNGSSTVSVIETGTQTVVATVPVGIGAIDVAVHPDGSKAYVSNQNENTISVIDTTSNLVIATVTGVGSAPQGVAAHPAGLIVYAVSWNGTDLSAVIDTISNTVTGTMPDGTNSVGIAVHPDGSRVYIANLGSNSLTVVNTAGNTLVATVPLAGGNGKAVDVAMHPDGSRVYVSTSLAGPGLLTVIETTGNAIVAEVTVGINPNGVSVHPDGGSVYVANSLSNNVSVIDTVTNLVIATIPVGGTPTSIGSFITPLPDTDGDGVEDSLDVCADTVIPESVPTSGLGVNRWALEDEDGIFDTTPPPGGGDSPQRDFNIEATAGCSCEQIIEALGLGKGHEKHGCSISAMEAYVELVNPL